MHSSAEPHTPAAEAPSRHRELGSFLRSRRERLAPADVGLAEHGRRRTPGLRREEVAALAGVSTTWYTWLEQGRAVSASPQVIYSLATALQLSCTEHRYLVQLAHPGRTPTTDYPTAVSPAVRAMLEHIEPWPAFVHNWRSDILAYNRTFAVLLCPLDELDPAERNSLWLAFTNARCIASMGESLDEVRAHLVGAHRFRLAQAPNDPTYRDLTDRLLATSQEFAQLWNRQDVAIPAEYPRKRFVHPQCGQLHFEVLNLWTRPSEGTRLTAYQPLDPHTEAGVAELLAQQCASAAAPAAPSASSSAEASAAYPQGT